MSEAMTAMRDRTADPVRDRKQDLILKANVLAPGSLRDRNVARFLRTHRLTRARRAQLRESHVIVVSYGGDIAGCCAYKLANGNVCVVHEFALHSNVSCERNRVVDVALDALEADCLASGRYAIVVLRTDIAAAVFKRRGYVVIIERCGGAWLQKHLSPKRGDQFGDPRTSLNDPFRLARPYRVLRMRPARAHH